MNQEELKKTFEDFNEIHEQLKRSGIPAQESFKLAIEMLKAHYIKLNTKEIGDLRDYIAQAVSTFSGLSVADLLSAIENSISNISLDVSTKQIEHSLDRISTHISDIRNTLDSK